MAEKDETGLLDSIGGLAKGLGITAKYLFKKPITVKYPYQKIDISERWRGPLYLKGMVNVYEPREGKETIPPCMGTCPVNVNPRLQNYLVGEGRYEEAYLAVRDRNILPGVLGRICNHPCESMCRRGAYDEPIAIKNLHRFIQEEYFKSEKTPPSFEKKYNKKIAIVGSGPAGLSSAYNLLKKGYKVEVFDRHPYPGGMLMIGVPKYRLPRDELIEEIKLLEDMGIDIQTGVEIGKDITLTRLSENYDAVIIAVGLQKSRSLNIPGAEMEGVKHAIPFLKKVNTAETADIGNEVVVIGGGNVAVDVARSAVRVGAEAVKMVCLEKREEMPAFSWEIEEAIEEGVRLYPGWGPNKVLGENKVEALEVVSCSSVFDERGNFSPTFDEEKTNVIKGDTVIFAIGQYGDMSFVEGSEVEVDERGRLVFNNETWQTTVENIFACGEIITGPSTAISSIGTGHRAAEKVHRYLQGKSITSDGILFKGEYPTPISPPLEIIKEEERKRKHMPKRKPMERKDSFVEIELGYPETDASKEAIRCLQCDTYACIGCGFCSRACPDYCIHIERKGPGEERTVVRWDYEMEKCSFCGLCVDACPTKTLSMSQEYELGSDKRIDFFMDREKMLRKVKDEL